MISEKLRPTAAPIVEVAHESDSPAHPTKPADSVRNDVGRAINTVATSRHDAEQLAVARQQLMELIANTKGAADVLIDLRQREKSATK